MKLTQRLAKILITIASLIIFFSSSCKKTDPGNTNNPNNPSGTPASVQVSTIAGSNNTNSLVGTVIPEDMAIDPSGNIYINDPYNNIVCKMDLNNSMSLLAGTVSLYTGGFADGTGSAAMFNYQHGIVSDASGNIFVADYTNKRIRKISPTGVVTTLAGSSVSGNADGIGANASFSSVHSITIDGSGNLYVVNNFTSIRKITPLGVVSTIFSGMPPFNGFGNLTLSSSGDFYLCYRQDHLIYKLSKAGVFSVFAGNGTKGSSDGVGTAATFSFPTGIVTDAAGNIYVSDQGTHLIRKITPAGVVTTIAGSGVIGSADGIGKQASFNFPAGMVIDANGNIYVGDEENKSIRKISPAGVVTTVLGAGTPINGAASIATFNQPAALVADAADNIYIADAGNNMIRKITAAGVVSTFAGNGKSGLADGGPSVATFNNPTGLSLDASGNLFVADYGNNELRKITSAGVVSSISLFVAANGATGPLNYPNGVAVDGSGNIFYTNTQWGSICKIAGTLNSTFSNGDLGSYGKFFLKPYGVAVDKTGNVYVADTENSRICKITPTGGTITIGGTSTPANFPLPGSNNGIGTSAGFNHPKGIAVDAAGNVYVADTGNNLIRKITPAGVVTTIAGLLVAGATDGNSSVASFKAPSGIAVNTAGTALYVSDTGNGRIRKITLQ